MRLNFKNDAVKAARFQPWQPFYERIAIWTKKKKQLFPENLFRISKSYVRPLFIPLLKIYSLPKCLPRIVEAVFLVGEQTLRGVSLNNNKII